jgi:hypothetical protein
MEERPRSGADTLGDARSQKRARKAPKALQSRAKVGDQVSHGTYTHSCFAYQIRCANWLSSLFMRRAPPAMSESAKNASGQEAFGSKGREVPVEQSPAVSTVDVTSSVIRAGATAASAAEKAGTSTATPAGGEC